MKAIYQKIIVVAICVVIGYCVWRYYRNNITKSNESYFSVKDTTKTIKDICENLEFDSQTNNKQNNKQNNDQSDVLAILDENTDITKYLKK
jgi:hypothetical protein